ncbi:MAG: amidase [Acidimicrobiales bacterium]
MTRQVGAVWIERYSGDPGVAGRGPRVAVKDLIDVKGSVTTAGCRAVAARAVPAEADASCITSVRNAGGRLAGKVNLHELAFGVTGVNPWFGTPENPADPGRIPGGSSSGSAVAVAIGEADAALGSDTGGSIRIPAACCGVVGLKTTHGRVPLDGVWPLAPSFDTIGPIATSVAGVVGAMRLVEPGFEPDGDPEGRVGRLILGSEVAIDPVIDEAVDAALRVAELEVAPIEIAGWHDAWRDQQVLLCVEALRSDGWLVDETGGEGIGADTLERLRSSDYEPTVVAAASARARSWVPTLLKLVEAMGVLALPALPIRPPEIGQPVRGFNLLCAPVNLAGLPAISLPVPARGRPPAGLQLVAAHGREELLVSLAARLETAVS